MLRFSLNLFQSIIVLSGYWYLRLCSYFVDLFFYVSLYIVLEMVKMLEFHWYFFNVLCHQVSIRIANFFMFSLCLSYCWSFRVIIYKCTDGFNLINDRCIFLSWTKSWIHDGTCLDPDLVGKTKQTKERKNYNI